MVYERKAVVRHDRDMCMAWHVLLFFVKISLFFDFPKRGLPRYSSLGCAVRGLLDHPCRLAGCVGHLRQ